MGLIARVRRPVGLLDLVERANKRTDEGHLLLFPRCGRCKVTVYDEGGLPVEKQKYVDSVEALEWGGEYARIRGKCHGQEHTLEIRFPKAINLDDEDDAVLWRAMWRGATFFDSELER
jgi:hypothetical protein